MMLKYSDYGLYQDSCSCGQKLWNRNFIANFMTTITLQLLKWSCDFHNMHRYKTSCKYTKYLMKVPCVLSSQDLVCMDHKHAGLKKIPNIFPLVQRPHYDVLCHPRFLQELVHSTCRITMFTFVHVVCNRLAIQDDNSYWKWYTYTAQDNQLLQQEIYVLVHSQVGQKMWEWHSLAVETKNVTKLTSKHDITSNGF